MKIGVNQGKELIDSLIDSKSVNICVVDDDTAQDGLVNGKYYAKLIIPEDFTKSLNKAQDSDREKTIITFSPNKKSNYLAYQIINNVVTKTELSLQAKVSEKIVASLKEKLEEVPGKMEDINNGVNDVLDGTTTLNNGLNTLNEGTKKLSTSYDTFDKGITNAYEGSSNLQSGINSVKSGTENLVSGTESASEAINKIQSGVQKISSKTEDGINNINAGVTQLVTGTNNFNTNFNDGWYRKNVQNRWFS